MNTSTLSRKIAISDKSMLSLSRARSNNSSLWVCHRCLSCNDLNEVCRYFSSIESDFLFPRASRSASNSSCWSLRTCNVLFNQSWYCIFSTSSRSSSVSLASALVENALVFRSRSKSLNLCMSSSILFLDSSSLSLQTLLTSPCPSHSRICALSRWSLLIDFFNSSPYLSFCGPLEQLAAKSHVVWNSSRPSSTFLRTTSISFCNFRAAAAVISGRAGVAQR
mmetsp:Transcript_126601/g.270046  ORF Transcript_126601/g.270046 Transcript_126601/m.270046 type:complete len:222 (-) Transcript_126601:81-746(-)